jgi:hypothetical protein
VSPELGKISDAPRPRGTLRLTALLMTTASALAIAGAARGACVTNPTVPYDNTGTIECVLIDDGLTHTGNVTNAGSGTISSSANNGVTVQSDTVIQGSIVNAGTVSITTGTQLMGIRLSSSTVTVDIDNSGNINTLASSIYVINGTVGGAIRNSGNLTATGSAAVGISVATSDNFANASQNASTVNGGIVNTTTGSIASQVVGIIVDGSSPNSAGVTINGGIVNDGSIFTELEGIAVSGNAGNLAIGGSAVINGGITNNGSLSSLYAAIAISAATVNGGILNAGNLVATQTGVLLTDDQITGDIANTGTIDSESEDSIEVVAGPIQLVKGGATFDADAEVQGSIRNAGTLIVPSGAEGIAVFGSGTVTVTITGNVSNSGAMGNPTGGTNVVGIYVGPNAVIDGAVSNTGNLDTATGVLISGGQVEGGVNNSGNVFAGSGYGILAQDGAVIDGGITNTGELSAGVGIQVTGATVNGGVNNAGALTATNIYLDGTINGNVTLSSHGDDLVIAGGSIDGSISGDVAINGANAGYVNIELGSGGAFTTQGPIDVAALDVVSGTTVLANNVTVYSTFTDGSTLELSGENTYTLTGVSSAATTFNQVAGGDLVIAVTPAASSVLDVIGTASLAGTVTFAYAPGTYSAKTYTFLESTGLSGEFVTVAAGSGNLGVPSGFTQSVTYTSDDANLVLASTASPPPAPPPPPPAPPPPPPPAPPPPPPPAPPPPPPPAPPPPPPPAPPPPPPPAPPPPPPPPPAPPAPPPPAPPPPPPPPPPVIVTPRDSAIFSDAAFAFAEENQASLTSLLARAGPGGAGDSFGLGTGGTGARGWIEAVGGFLDPGPPDSPRFHATSGGVEGGVDIGMGSGARVGAALGYESSSLADSDGGSANGNTLRVSLYGQTTLGQVVFSGALDYAHASEGFARASGFGASLSTRDIDEGAGAAEASLPLNAGGTSITPSVGLVVASLSATAFQETNGQNGAFAVSGGASNGTFVSPFATVTVSHAFTRADGLVVIPAAEVGYRADGAAAGLGVSLTAPDGTPFAGNTAALGRSSGLVGASLTARQGRFAGFVRYQADIAGNWNLQAVQAGFKVAF